MPDTTEQSGSIPAACSSTFDPLSIDPADLAKLNDTELYDTLAPLIPAARAAFSTENKAAATKATGMKVQDAQKQLDIIAQLLKAQQQNG